MLYAGHVSWIEAQKSVLATPSLPGMIYVFPEALKGRIMNNPGF
jgi:hypothetical protein